MTAFKQHVGWGKKRITISGNQIKFFIIKADVHVFLQNS